MNPVPNILTVTIHRQRFVAECVNDHKRDEFFRKLVRAVVVRTPRYRNGKPMSMVVCESEQVGAGFARCIWTARMNGGQFSEFSGWTQGAVYFISRHMEKFFYSDLPCSLEQNVRADDVRLHEHRRTQNAPIDMRFRGTMYYLIDLVFPKSSNNLLTVADIAPGQGVPCVVLNILQVLEVAGICDLVVVDNLNIFALPEKKPDE